jgi:hypothetical protein
LAALDPLGVVTTTLAVPTVPAGVVQLALVGLATLNRWQATPPTVMLVTPQRLVPAIWRLVFPVDGPEVGVMEVTVGAGQAGGVSMVRTALSAVDPEPQVHV